MATARTLALSAALLAASASAEEIYFTTGFAHGSFDATAPAGCTLNATSASATGGSLGVGYRFSDPLAIEFGYLTLGSLDINGLCGVTPFTLTGPDSGLIASGVGRLTLSHGWALLGRAGFYSWSAAAQSGTEAVLGVGAEYEWTRGWAARLEYSTLGADLTAIALTVRIGF